ncbi:hypothetical protein A1O3_07612 [Capronia epimyces CBS 606.96]|uniref:DNA ligase D 3'-phosphoesterase domain-containing protein n=1 Tax=Capronia epimyces CBS 606.96 TaxID=1182542 RepID=W9XLB7_9EURO|nr:uncharacterized protein A1O3_07612 [Capronia epimyces CBS 606.96]EXJ81322.1 hypothetical protein A1O3_07612 [Capronia epimyces CBS 606.96]
MKRHNIDDPIVKAENQSWELSRPASLNRSVSPPPTNRCRREDRNTRRLSNSGCTPISAATKKSATAAVEAGEIQIDDHVSFFSSKLLAARRPEVHGQARLPHDQWLELYRRNLNDRGHHFVIHQHDHPVAGTHYDLRLQCNATSSISFAIMYGLPGDPNSKRLNRNATETRVHNLWNHLIETASHETGTMLIWDTGEYTVLPYKTTARANNDTDTSEDSDSDVVDLSRVGEESQPLKLHRAFQTRKIKLRLHGTRLPKNYTISLRLHSENDRVNQPEPPAFKRRRTNLSSFAPRRRRARAQVETSDSSRPSSPDHPNLDSGDDETRHTKRPPRTNSTVPSLHRTASPPILTRGTSSGGAQASKLTKASIQIDAETLGPNRALKHNHNSNKSVVKPKADFINEEALTHLNNAYPGAVNSINSIHQRRWFLSLDRAANGFRPTNETAYGRRIWERVPIGMAGRTKLWPESTSGSASNSRKDVSETELEAQPQTGEALGGFELFHVLGRDFETSILTGRTAADVAKDEGMVGYRPRGGWRPVTE